MKAKVKWVPNVSGMGFEGIGPSGHKLLMDAVSDFGGEDKGVRPFELLLLSLGGCTAMDVISVLKKKKQEVESFEIELEAERDKDYPKGIKKVNINYVLNGKNLKPEAVEKAIELSQEKYCSVAGTLRDECELTKSFEIR